MSNKAILLINKDEISEEIAQELKVIEKAKSDPRHFEVLYNRYYKAIFLFVHKRIADHELVSDITSQVFYKALSNLPKYKFMGYAFGTWLYKIALNEINEYYRKAKVRRVVGLDNNVAETLAGDLNAAESDSEENIKKLKAALATLDYQEMQLIELRYFEGKSFRDISFILNITENNAKVRTYRLLDKIKKAFETTNKLLS